MTKRRILWADDQIDQLRSQVLFLEQKGFEVVGVPNGDDALDLLASERFDAVLLDEQMPGRGGLETLQGIRERDGTIPVIMVTKSEEEHTMETALGRSVDDYLVKPVHPTQVLLALKKALEQGGLQEEQTKQDYLRGFNEMLRLRMEARGAADWLGIYDRMVSWELKLQELEDPGLAEMHAEQLLQANSEFGRMVQKDYAGWIAGQDAPVLSHDVVPRYVAPHLREGRPTFLFVVDCMRLDQWRILEAELEAFFNVDTELYYGLLPTATPFSRNAIFAGLTPLQIARQFPQYWRGSAKEERSKNAHERELLAAQLDRLGMGSKKLKYYKTFNAADTESMRKQLPSLGGVDLVVGVVNFLDILAHGRSHNDLLQELAPDQVAFRSAVHSWFRHSAFFGMLRDLAGRGDCAVVITTDHGSVQVRKASMVKANRDASTNVRYKYGDNLTVDAKEAFVMKQPEDYGLPAETRVQNFICALDYNYFVYPTNYHEYERQYRDSFQHGGVSLEEMVVPCATLRPR